MAPGLACLLGVGLCLRPEGKSIAFRYHVLYRILLSSLTLCKLLCAAVSLTKRAVVRINWATCVRRWELGLTPDALSTRERRCADVVLTSCLGLQGPCWEWVCAQVGALAFMWLICVWRGWRNEPRETKLGLWEFIGCV